MSSYRMKRKTVGNQQAQPNEGPKDLYKRAHEIVIANKEALVLAILQCALDGSVMGAKLLLDLANMAELKTPETGPRRVSLIDKWLSEPEWTPEMEAAKNSGSATPATEVIAPTTEAPTAVNEAASETEAAPTATVANEIGLAPHHAASNQVRQHNSTAQSGSHSEFRPCRNPVHNPSQPGPQLPDSFHPPSLAGNSGQEGYN